MHPGVTLLALVFAVPAFGSPLALTDCRISAGPAFPGIKARCGTLERPLDPAAADSPVIELAVAVVPALDLEPEPDPFVPIAGGPGQSSIEFYSAYHGAFEPVRRDRDILLVDQRGTGDSARLDCPVDQELITGGYSREQTLASVRACLEVLPHDPRFFTTSVAVTDLEAVRQALGYPRLNVYGISYGSRVAQHYARRYPEKTRTVVLDGVVPPQVALGPEIATEAQNALDAIFARCAEDAACNQRFPAIEARFRMLLSELDGHPVDVSIPDPLTGEITSFAFGRAELAAAIRLLAYQPATVALVPLMVDAAAEGNFRPLAAQYLMTVVTIGESLALGMHNSVLCSEDAAYYDRSAIDYPAIEASYMGIYQLDAIDAICSLWPAGPVDPGFDQPLGSETLPVLLLSGSADPITPPRYAELAMAGLGRARHYTGEDQGHGQAPVGCMPQVLGRFVESADPDVVDDDCLGRSFVMPFFLDFTGPAP